MINLKGYNINDKIYKGRNSTIYRGIRVSDKTPVIIKLLDFEYPAPEQLARFKREFDITKKLNSNGIVKVYSLEKYERSRVIILEDIKAESVKKIVSIANINFLKKLYLAIRMTDILIQVHQQGFIHKDINPSNYIWNQDTNSVKIIDFGIASQLTRENPEIRNPNIIEGTLHYISPEQTGRMNRTIDYRTDLYSLGVTFYELFTGQLPFQANDPMEIVYCHIAKIPPAPSSLNPDIPSPVSDIIMKLLSKGAEDRYNTGIGLKKDLEICYEQFKLKGCIDPFEIGERDISDRLLIPEKLYGREKEAMQLHDAFSRVSNGNKEIMIVKGFSGIGKSALVNEAKKGITEKKGNFISGKYDQFKRNIPYSALISAFRELINNLLAEDEDRLLQWKQRLLDTLGNSGQLVVDVIPEVELIIGGQPALQELDVTQSRNRFNIVFQNFIRVFARKDCPLVIFLDDLQWADLPSLQLIEQFMRDIDTGYMLIIFAYRDNEVQSSHPLMMTIDELEKAGTVVNSIKLNPLEFDHVNQLLSETLRCSRTYSYNLAELCLRKTLGNPFFLNQLLHSFYEDGCIEFNTEKGEWQFDIIQIEKADITENVIELMASKIQKLPEDTREILKIASCMGNTFSLNTLAIVSNRSKMELSKKLLYALKENFIMSDNDVYSLISESPDALISEKYEDLDIQYKFLHDRIQYAAYSLIDDDLKQDVHLRIGRLLLNNTEKENLKERIFDIVNHFNYGKTLVTDKTERDRLSELNLLAAGRAKKSAAYQPAYDYAKTGIELAGQDGWQRCYTHVLNLYGEAIETSYLNGNYEETHKLYLYIIENAQSILDKIKAYEIEIMSLISEGKYKESLSAGLEILKLFGVTFPKKPSMLHAVIGLLKIKRALSGKTDEVLISLKKMQDPDSRAIMKILTQMSSAAIISSPELLPLLTFKGIHLSLQYGNDPYASASRFVLYGVILSAVGDMDGAYRFGNFSEQLVERFDVNAEKTKVLVFNNLFGRHWKNHIRETFPSLLRAYKMIQETGDVEYAGHAAASYSNYIFYCGKNLLEIEKEQLNLLNEMKMLKQQSAVDLIGLYHQATCNLLNPERILPHISGKSFNEDETLPALQKAGNVVSLIAIYVYKLNLYYLSGDFQKAFENSVEAFKYINAAAGMYVIPYMTFYDCLTRLALCKNATAMERKSHLKIVAMHQKKIKKWASHAPMNHLHKWHLVEAERTRVLNKTQEAKTHYKQAIKGAGENEYTQEQALAYELYAKFFLDQGEEDFAGMYLRNAHFYYRLWGAAGKVTQLEKEYPMFFKNKTETAYYEKNILMGSDCSTTTTSGSSESLDLFTIMKAARSISKEIVLSNLLIQLMKVCMENAGAEKGFMILEENGMLYIEAEALSGEDNKIEVLNSIPLDGYEELSSAIVNYTARTKKNVILNNASIEGNFSSDPYIVKNKPKSILCIPIINRGDVSSILYLENNLSENTFTPDRIKILEILAAQAAISIDNSRLYENLEEKVKERTRELSEAQDALWGEMELAKKIQTVLLPEKPAIKGYDIEAFMAPADEVGGDYYDIINAGNYNWLFIGDVSGHGVPAGLIMMMVQTTIQAIVRNTPDILPSRLLSIVNAAIVYNINRMGEKKYMTITAFSVQENGDLFFAGLHQPLLIYRAETDDVECLETEGMWIGITEDIESLLSNEKTTLYPGDVLLLFSDGITEARRKNSDEDTSNSKMFGEKQLMEILQANGKLSADVIKNKILAEMDNYITTDDITMVVFKRL